MEFSEPVVIGIATVKYHNRARSKTHLPGHTDFVHLPLGEAGEAGQIAIKLRLGTSWFYVRFRARGRVCSSLFGYEHPRGSNFVE
jgi:hypothetical protein